MYAGGHGTGPWGDMVRAALAAEGITVLRPPDPDVDTGFDVALVEAGGERTFVTSLGAETLREPGTWDPVRAGVGDAVYVSGYGLAAPGSGAILGAWAAGLAPAVLLFVFLAALAAALPPSAAARRANAAAALVVTRPGPAVFPSRAELDAFLAADGRFRPTP